MFVKAERKKAKARIALLGPSGSGKTYTSLLFARELAEAARGKVAVIDTERGSASLYAGEAAQFDVCELASFEPDSYVTAIEEAGRVGYACLVIDSLSHAWAGKGGALEKVDEAASRSNSRNTHFAWREVTPMHNRLVDTILQYPGHVVVTMRVRTAYDYEDVDGRKVPKKIGLAPVQRDGMEYEFTLTGDLDHSHRLVVSKSRCSALDDKVVSRPDARFIRILIDWLESGVDEETRLAALLSSAEGALDLDGAAKEVARAAKSKMIDAAAIERLTAAGQAARARIQGVAAEVSR